MSTKETSPSSSNTPEKKDVLAQGTVNNPNPSPVVGKTPEQKTTDLVQQKQAVKEVNIQSPTRVDLEDKIIQPFLKSVNDTLSSLVGAHPENFMQYIMDSIQKFLTKLGGKETKDTQGGGATGGGPGGKEVVVQKTSGNAMKTPTTQNALYDMTEIAPSALGAKMVSVARSYIGMPYKWAGRPAAMSMTDVQGGRILGDVIPGSGGRFNSGGVDCIGLWWAVWKQAQFVKKDGTPLQWNFFSQDGYSQCIPQLSSQYDTFSYGGDSGRAVAEMAKYPEGSLIAFPGHVGVVGKNGLIHASNSSYQGKSGVREEPWQSIFSYYARNGGCRFRVLRPENMRTAPNRGPKSVTA